MDSRWSTAFDNLEKASFPQLKCSKPLTHEIESGIRRVHELPKVPSVMQRPTAYLTWHAHHAHLIVDKPSEIMQPRSTYRRLGHKATGLGFPGE